MFMKNIKNLILVAALIIGASFTLAAQEGAMFGDYAPGFYFDKEGNKVEGLIKYTITTSEGIEKIKSFKFKKNEGDDDIKIKPDKSDGFGLVGSDRVYHTVYSSEKNKKKNKKGRFARVLYGGTSVTENASMYYPLDDSPKNMIEGGKEYLSVFMVRYKGTTVSTKISLIMSKHKKTFKKLFADCPQISKEIKEDASVIKVSNLENIINRINTECN